MLLEIKRKMPNEIGSESPSPFLQIPEEFGAENIPPPTYQCCNNLQDLINRQEKFENALKVVYDQNKQLTKENKMLWTEVTNLKTKQMNTEKATKALNGQNNQLIKKNSYLWSELIMNRLISLFLSFTLELRERYERKIEKLMVFLLSVIQNSGKNPHTLFKKKSILFRNFYMTAFHN